MTKRNQNKIIAVAGAVALLSMNGHVSAQSAVEALLNKLEQKGVLTVEEAQALKAENTQDTAVDLKKAMDARFPMPNWVTSYKLSGDFRGRFEKFAADNTGTPDRNRMRYRLRVGLTVNLKDDLEVGLRLASGDPVGGFATQTGNPVSANTTFQDNFSRKFLYLDAAYGKWTPLHTANWTASATIGKMDNPFRLSNMVFDYDLDPEGVALQSAYQINNKHSLSFNGAMFIMDEAATSSHDPTMFGAQLIWDAKWTPRLESSVGLSGFDIFNSDMLTTANVPYYNQGNTRTTGGSLVNDYTPIIASASMTYKLDKFPLYAGAFPIKLEGEYMNNVGASANNEGFRGGITFGKAGSKKTWSLGYRYQELQADAWYDAMVDDDNVAFYANAPAGGKTGWFGGTNVRGHLVMLNYSFTDALTFTFTGYFNDLINQKPGGVNEPGNHAFHGMADISWKF